MKAILLGVATIVVLTGAITSYADPVAHDARTLSVSYGDLNVASKEGANTLYTRLEYAARKVCAADDLRRLGAAKEARDCRASAIDRAVNDIGSANLTALHRSESAPVELASANRASSATR